MMKYYRLWLRRARGAWRFDMEPLHGVYKALDGPAVFSVPGNAMIYVPAGRGLTKAMRTLKEEVLAECDRAIGELLEERRQLLDTPLPSHRMVTTTRRGRRIFIHKVGRRAVK